MSASMPRLLHAGRFAGDRDCPWHAHDGHELVLVTAGTCRMTCGAVELACVPGTLAVLPKGQPQYQHTDSPTSTSYVVWQAGDGVFDPTVRTLTLALDSRPARWIDDLCALFEQEADPQVVDALLLALLADLAQLAARCEQDAALHPALAEAIRLLTGDLTEQLDLTRLAARCGIGASHLARLFLRHHGCPPLRYQQRLRLRLAERLLQDPQLTVAEVGRRCGWPDPNYFGRVFSKHAGAPPATWRGSRRAG